MTTPFNVKLPEDARPVEVDNQQIGWVWPCKTTPHGIDDSIAHLAQKKDRWGSMTLDGIVISRNSRTYREAVKTLRSGIARRGKEPVSRARKA